MAPLPFASLSDLNSYYNPQNNIQNVNNNFQQTTNQITQDQLSYNNKFSQNNSNYQQSVQNQEISQKPNFKENKNPISETKLGSNNEIPPNIPNTSINYTQNATRPGWTNILNSFPINQGINMFNRFQTPIEYLSEHDQLVALLQEISFILKLILILFILMVVSKICEKK